MRWLQCLSSAPKQREGQDVGRPDATSSAQPAAEASFNHHKQHDIPVLLWQSFRQLIKKESHALAKRCQHGSSAVTPTVQADVCETTTPKSQDSVERHVSFQEDMDSDRFAAQPHPAPHGVAHRRSENSAPLCSALRRRSKFASTGVTPEMDLMLSTGLPLLASVLWFLCCSIYNQVSFAVLDIELMWDVGRACFSALQYGFAVLLLARMSTVLYQRCVQADHAF